MVIESKVKTFPSKPGFDFVYKEDGYEVWRVYDVPETLKVILSVRDTDDNEQHVGAYFMEKATEADTAKSLYASIEVELEALYGIKLEPLK